MNGHRIRASKESSLWRRKFSSCSCWLSNPWPDYQWGALPSYPDPVYLHACLPMVSVLSTVWLVLSTDWLVMSAVWHFCCVSTVLKIFCLWCESLAWHIAFVLLRRCFLTWATGRQRNGLSSLWTSFQELVPKYTFKWMYCWGGDE